MYDDELLSYAQRDLPAIEDADDAYTNNRCGDVVAVRSITPPLIAVDGCLVCRAAAAKTRYIIKENGKNMIKDMEADRFLKKLGWNLTTAREECALTVLRAIQQA